MNFEIERIRLLFDVEDLNPAVDQFANSESPQMWRGNDVQFELGFQYDSEILNMANYQTIKLIVKDSANRRGLKLMEKSISVADITPIFTQEQWDDKSQQHCTIAFTAAETKLDLKGDDARDFWLIIIGVTNTGKRLTLGNTIVTINDDGDDSSDVTPPLGSSIIPPGATYDGSGHYALAVTQNKWYGYVKGTNDTSVTNGNQTLAADGNFAAQTTAITLNGTPSALVTASIRYPVFLTMDESDARFQLKQAPFSLSPNKRYLRVFGVTDNKEPIDQIVDLQNQ